MEKGIPSVAVIGCGYWGKNIVRNFAALGELGAISDLSEANAQAMSTQYSIPAVGFDEILAAPDIRGVAIAVPAPLHADLACACLAAGKHVMVEKPIALGIEEAERMISTARKADRLLMVGHLLNYHPAFLKVLELTQDGTIGSIRRIYSNRLSLGKLRTDENVMWSFAPHDISMILRLVGGRSPSRVDASGAAYLTPGISDFAHIHMSFDSGATAHVFTSWLHPFKEQKLVVVGDRGMVVFDDTASNDRKVALYRHVAGIKDGQPVVIKAEAEFIAFSHSEPLHNECQAFLDGMGGMLKVYTDGAEGLRVLEVLSRAQSALMAKE